MYDDVENLLLNISMRFWLKTLKGHVVASSNGEHVAFDARVVSVITSELPERLVLELRTNEGIMKANVAASFFDETAWKSFHGVTPESLVHVTGYVSSLSSGIEYKGNGISEKNKKDKATLGDTHELNVTDITIVAPASASLPPFNRNEFGLGQRLDNRLLDLRNAGSGAIFKLHSGMCLLIVEFLSSDGFHWIHQPRIISHRVAGDKEYFDLPYFGGAAWLAQNSQYQNQMILSTDMQRVFDIGPAFRAEAKSRTSSRHLTEVGQTPFLLHLCFTIRTQV